MNKLSRRQLAKYAVDELVAKQRPGGLASRLAAALLASGRRKEVDLLISDIDRELEDRGLLAVADVTTAHALTQQLQASLSDEVKRLTKTQSVSLRTTIDKDLLGGFRIETANKVWDKSLKRRLMALKGNV